MQSQTGVQRLPKDATLSLNSSDSAEHGLAKLYENGNVSNKYERKQAKQIKTVEYDYSVFPEIDQVENCHPFRHSISEEPTLISSTPLYATSYVFSSPLFEARNCSSFSSLHVFPRRYA